ncbi:hypothetical protein M378DRAFT_167572, partial [Amanita muscaria Koide BX008]
VVVMCHMSWPPVTEDYLLRLLGCRIIYSIKDAGNNRRFLDSLLTLLESYSTSTCNLRSSVLCRCAYFGWSSAAVPEGCPSLEGKW